MVIAIIPVPYPLNFGGEEGLFPSSDLPDFKFFFGCLNLRIKNYRGLKRTEVFVSTVFFLYLLCQPGYRCHLLQLCRKCNRVYSFWTFYQSHGGLEISARNRCGESRYIVPFRSQAAAFLRVRTARPYPSTCFRFPSVIRNSTSRTNDEASFRRRPQQYVWGFCSLPFRTPGFLNRGWCSAKHTPCSSYTTFWHL